MRISNGGSTTSISRRKGTSRGRKGGDLVLNQKSILVLGLIVGTIFLLGLIVGTRIFGSPAIDNATSNNNNDGGIAGHNGKPQAEASPLLAATSKIAPSDIQKLILESAQAEADEKAERKLEIRARKNGDAKLAAHLRGALAPGDKNYNPHHSIDDVVDELGVGDGGDGAMYAGAGGGGDDDAGESPLHVTIKSDDGEGGDVDVTHGEGEDSMHNHFVDAMKNELEHVKKGKKKIVDSMHNEFDHLKDNLDNFKVKARDVAKKGVSKLRGKGGGGGQTSYNSDNNEFASSAKNENKEYYPYMTTLVPANYDFSRYEPLGGNRFLEYKDGLSPYAITDNLKEQSDELARSRRVHVLGAMKHCWSNYQKYAFGKDELHPISKRSTSNWGGMGTTLVDSLDTLWLMGMKEEFWEARDWVRDHLSHDNVGDVSGFETTIRSLGGLLSAYDLSKDKVFLDKADELGGRLIRAYDTKSGLPHGSVSLSSGASHNFGWNSNAYIIAEVGTQQIEYRYLSRATGKTGYAKKAEKVFDILHEMQPDDGLMFQNIQDSGGGAPRWANSKVSFGAMSDSVYEYLLKTWVQGGKKEPRYREMWDKAMMGLHDQLVQKSHPNGFTYIADRNGGKLDHKMDHLVCFMGGALALGAYTDPKGFDSPRAQRDLKTAKALTYTCYQMYAKMKTGIAPEFVRFGGKDDLSISSAPFYILRPETVEAFYYLSVLTGDPIYREWGWEVFQSIEKYCKTKYGYGSLKNVNQPGSVDDRMESFFLAETMKYLYLLFDPDSEIDILNKHVFNTEAHPLQIFED